jgi:formylglycine-generating enzyme required for sulfatase activity
LPIVNVSWDDAKSYVAWLSRITGKRYRLLSEAEWEYAARSEPPSAGSPQPDTVAGAATPATRTSIRLVGVKKANGFGLHDMADNVSEWLEDCFNSRYTTDMPADGSAQTGVCSYHVIRGGANGEGNATGASVRKPAPAKLRQNTVGFRVARRLDQ